MVVLDMQIIEIDAVGLAGRGNEHPRVFIHQQKGPPFSKETNIRDAFIKAAKSGSINVSKALL